MKPLDPLARAVIDAARMCSVTGAPRTEEDEALIAAIAAFDASEKPVRYITVDRVDVRAGDEVLLPKNRIWRKVKKVAPDLSIVFVDVPTTVGRTYYTHDRTHVGPCRVRRRAP